MTMRDSASGGEIVEERGAVFEVFALPSDEYTLFNILSDCFLEWGRIRIGLLIPGALWEIRPPRQPRLSLHNGYATIDFQDWHIHLCIGEQQGMVPGATNPGRTGFVELYRRLNRKGQPIRWGLRLLNGAGDQQITFMLPSPFLSDAQQTLQEPDWDRLALWNRLWERYLEP